MYRQLVLGIFLFWTYTLSAQKDKFSGQLFSADILMGYNLARIQSDYLLEEKMPYSFQINWQHSNYDTPEKLGFFGYSDFGAGFLYHDFRDNSLGKNYAIVGFMEYYLWKPTHRLQLSFRLSYGIAYNTKPYHKTTNSKNKLFGSHILFPLDFVLYLKYPRIYRHWGIQAGFGIFHYSNANLQSPNYGANMPTLTLGINYDYRNKPVEMQKKFPAFNKKWQYLAFLRFGINESDYYDSGIFPFFIPGFQMEKHLNFRHKINLGAELFLSYFLREQIRYEYYAMPEFHVDKIADFKRFGVYGGHEFFYQKIGIVTTMGYYVYYPYKFESRFYNRLALNLYLSKHLKTMLGLKFHYFSRAEALEIGVMYKFN